LDIKKGGNMVGFKVLWDNHPTITGDDNPCSTEGKRNYHNQCAIRMGTCLAKCDVDTTKIPGVTHCSYHEKSQGHTIRAEELAIGLTKHQIAGIQKMQEIDPKEFKNVLNGKTGIIFFKDYWQRSGERNRSGDHIDLWNGSRLTHWVTWIRIQWGISIDGYWSDYKRSQSIWFWRVI
jgi:hypothetical protein